MTGKHFSLIFIIYLLVVTSISAQDVAITDIAWNADGSLLAIAKSDGSIEISNPDSSIIVPIQVSDFHLQSISWHPTITNRVAIDIWESPILIMDYIDSELIPIAEINPGLWVRELTWNKTGDWLMVVGETDTGITGKSVIQIWDYLNNQTVYTWEFENFFDKVVDVAWHPTEKDIFLVSVIRKQSPSRILRFNLTSQAVDWEYTDKSWQLLDLAWNLDGTLFASSREDYESESVQIIIHDATTGKNSTEILIDSFHVSELAWYPSKYLAIPVDSGIQIWDVNTLTMIDEIVDTIALSTSWNNNGQLAYNTLNRTISIYDVDLLAGKPIN